VNMSDEKAIQRVVSEILCNVVHRSIEHVFFQLPDALDQLWKNVRDAMKEMDQALDVTKRTKYDFEKYAKQRLSIAGVDSKLGLNDLGKVYYYSLEAFLYGQLNCIVDRFTQECHSVHGIRLSRFPCTVASAVGKLDQILRFSSKKLAWDDVWKERLVIEQRIGNGISLRGLDERVSRDSEVITQQVAVWLGDTMAQFSSQVASSSFCDENETCEPIRTELLAKLHKLGTAIKELHTFNMKHDAETEKVPTWLWLLDSFCLCQCEGDVVSYALSNLAEKRGGE
jgi:hypothetical protein